ncbi:MAG: hypothetical protein JF570_01435 [Caulobacter sp.]|nr:hypothetical protein [Caulobacter sp.]
MRIATTVLITALLAASAAQAAPTYRQEVVDVFKSVCLPAGTDAAAVGVAAAKLGWKPAPASIKALWQGPATKVWVSPASARFYLAQAPQDGFCPGTYLSPAYPGLKMYVVVANFPDAATFVLSTAKP